mgnify:CR=1 FL=1
MKMGDTPSVLYFLSGDPDDPESQHWGGQFFKKSPQDRPNYWHDAPEKDLSMNGKNGAVTVNRWRTEYLTDWAGQMNKALNCFLENGMERPLSLVYIISFQDL